MQVGYLINGVGEFGKSADLRRDAKALAAMLQSIVSKYNGAQYRSLQQKGMSRDSRWDLPAQEWEQVNAIFPSYVCIPTSLNSLREALRIASQPEPAACTNLSIMS